MTRDLRVLTTSRAPLGLSSESVYPLPALDLPTAVELFRQRAQAARPGADLADGAVEELCRHLDGLPLAIELAAARVRVMSVPEIARRLDDRFALLRGNARDAPSRHRTMHAVVDWSWNLLSPSGRAAMRALSIFPAGFTADAARHLLLGGEALPSGDEVLEVLEDLVDQSLLEVVEGVPGTRFRMLESVREFSGAHREAEGETERAVAGLLAWAREFGAMHHGQLFGAEPFDFVERVRVEQDNLLHVHRHGLARQDGAAVAAVAAVLGGMWTLESAYSRLIVLLEEGAGLLSRFRPGPEDVEATRTALALSVLMTSMLKGPRATRALVALRRLPAPPPTDPVRAMALMMASMPEILGPDSPVLTAMCASDAPSLAAVANFGAGLHVREERGSGRRGRGHRTDARRGRYVARPVAAAARPLAAQRAPGAARPGRACPASPSHVAGADGAAQVARHVRADVGARRRAHLPRAIRRGGAVARPVTPPGPWAGRRVRHGHVQSRCARGDRDRTRRRGHRAAAVAGSGGSALPRSQPDGGVRPGPVDARSPLRHRRRPCRHGRLDLVEDIVAGLPPSSPLCSPTGRSRCRPSSWTCPSAAVCCSPSPRRNSPDPMSGRTVGRGPRARSRSRSGSTTSGRSSRRCRPRPLAAPPRTPTGGVCRRGVGVRRPRP
ncbi:hypothetical protein LUX39_34605 [Actinomadura madurae]|nr:hypothetical protein [Actinomadura madurae]MCQ0018290.1 hypothetical protein [Actinomadura madurae]